MITFETTRYTLESVSLTNFATPSYCDPGTNPEKPRLTIKSQGFPGKAQW